MVRQYLAEQIDADTADVAMADGLLKLATKRAGVLSMPCLCLRGDVLHIAAPLIGNASGPNGGPPGGGKKPGDTQKTGDAPKGRPRLRKNDCPRCVIDLCRASEWAKAKNNKDVEKYCLVMFQVDTSKPVPHYLATGPSAPTASELSALKVDSQPSSVILHWT